MKKNSKKNKLIKILISINALLITSLVFLAAYSWIDGQGNNGGASVESNARPALHGIQTGSENISDANTNTNLTAYANSDMLLECKKTQDDYMASISDSRMHVTLEDERYMNLIDVPMIPIPESNPTNFATEVLERRFIVAIDPGHQRRGNYEREPNGPGSTVYKAKVASGTQGVSSGVSEFQLVLDVSLLLRDELRERGFDVFMVRETNDVNISNRERAIMATEANADIFVRVHANGSANSSANGILTISHSRNNPYIPELYDLSRSLSDHILASMVEATGARNLGVLEMDNMTGSNWSTVPVTIVEMGFMTNPQEDELMQTLGYQQKLVTGMANGIEAYFSEHFGV